MSRPRQRPPSSSARPSRSRGHAPAASPATAPAAPAGMAWVPPGEFVMGDSADDGMEWERPTHRVRLDGFFIDAHEVTNARFRKFVEATGYVTVAEKPIDWDEMKR